jgi:hypothetical protein
MKIKNLFFFILFLSLGFSCSNAIDATTTITVNQKTAGDSIKSIHRNQNTSYYPPSFASESWEKEVCGNKIAKFYKYSIEKYISFKDTIDKRISVMLFHEYEVKLTLGSNEWIINKDFFGEKLDTRILNSAILSSIDVIDCSDDILKIKVLFFIVPETNDCVVVEKEIKL